MILKQPLQTNADFRTNGIPLIQQDDTRTLDALDQSSPFPAIVIRVTGNGQTKVPEHFRRTHVSLEVDASHRQIELMPQLHGDHRLTNSSGSPNERVVSLLDSYQERNHMHPRKQVVFVLGRNESHQPPIILIILIERCRGDDEFTGLAGDLREDLAYLLLYDFHLDLLGYSR